MQARDEEQDFEVAVTVGNDDFGRPNRTECGDLRPAEVVVADRDCYLEVLLFVPRLHLAHAVAIVASPETDEPGLPGQSCTVRTPRIDPALQSGSPLHNRPEGGTHGPERQKRAAARRAPCVWSWRHRYPL